MGKNAEVGHVYNKEQQEIQNKTGYNGDQDILKNIYDLEGNNMEWTAQASDTFARVFRGRCFVFASMGNFLPASSLLVDYSFLRDTNTDVSSRSTLYLH